MTDTTEAPSFDWSSDRAGTRRRRRYAADRRLKLYGIAAIAVAIGLLGILIASLVTKGYLAFVETVVTFDVTVPAGAVDPADPAEGNYRKFVSDSFEALFPGVTDRRAKRDLGGILSRGAALQVRDRVISDPDLIGQTFSVTVPVSDPFDQLAKGVIDRTLPENRRRVADREIAWFEQLEAQGRVERVFNSGLFLDADSRFPELAGLAGAIVGSFYALLVCFLISFPLGIAAAVYLEEFAPKNRITDLIEVNINNLAAVPSIVFGLLGLALFIQTFGLPRSAP
ncbi:MAG: DUF3333 domain-containing protein, partial [Alphaproteobacteria bacterium]|nr:DUF3333 domain-containing protein [Alphaproteobacteria bacterium]MDX5370558.1 DUF3333 domain-containing protein [Alphaproteobacteria bacterium]MDX5465042.1 DUF3333 domain-containing protein [Alphaproteobacteria bacterium]